MPLKITDRPNKIKDRIDSAFEHVKKINIWRDNGKASYELCHINELKLLVKMIEERPNQKLFKIMDLGAGDFSFGNHLLNELSTCSDISNNTKFKIISVRGNPNSDQEIIFSTRGEHIQLGEFKIENLCEELSNHGIEHENTFDLIVSSWTLRHLVDPVGTMLQIHQCLKPNGILLADGFFFNIEGHNPMKGMPPLYGSNLYNLLKICHDSGDEICYFTNKDNGEQDNFLLKKQNTSISLPFEYVGSNSLSLPSNESDQVICFRDLSGQIKDIQILNVSFLQLDGIIVGNKNIFNQYISGCKSTEWVNMDNHILSQFGQDGFVGCSPQYRVDENGLYQFDGEHNMFCLGDHSS